MAAGLVALVLALVLMGAASLFSGPGVLETAAFTLTGASLPLILGGLVLLDAQRDWIRACGGIGLALCLGALFMFAAWFPDAWGSSLGVPNAFAVAQYVAGLTLLSAGSSGAVAATLARRSPEEGPPPGTPTNGNVEPELPPRERFTWGAVSKDRPGVKLVVSDGLEELEIEGVAGDPIRIEDGQGVAQAAQQLLDMKGRRVRRSTETGVQDQVQRLQALRLWDSIELEEVRPWWSKLLRPFQ